MEERYSIACLKGGDINGLAPLVRMYQVRAIRAAYLIVRDRALAEDIVQTAFVRTYDRIHQFDANRPFGPWFLKSVVNDSLKALARQNHQVSLERAAESDENVWANHLTDSASGILELAENADIQRAIWEALYKLTPAQRSAIVLRYYLDFSEAEMAEKLQRPPGTVKWLLSAARERLRDLLHPLRPNAHSERRPVSDKD